MKSSSLRDTPSRLSTSGWFGTIFNSATTEFVAFAIMTILDSADCGGSPPLAPPPMLRKASFGCWVRRLDDRQPVLPNGTIDVLLAAPGLRFQIDDVLSQPVGGRGANDFPRIRGIGFGDVAVERGFLGTKWNCCAESKLQLQTTTTRSTVGLN